MTTEIWLPPQLIDQTPKETRSAYAAFLAYCRMGAGRSLRALHEQFCDQAADETCTVKPPTTRLPTVTGWSSKFDWQERVNEYDQQTAQRLEINKQGRQDRLENASFEDFEAMLNEWRRRWKLIEAAPGAVTLAEFRDVVRARKELDDFGRRAVGLPNQITEHSGKVDTGGPQIIIATGMSMDEL